MITPIKIYTKLLDIWRYNVIRADSIYEEILNIDEKEKERNCEEELCLDDVMSTVYKPCGHRVCVIIMQKCYGIAIKHVHGAVSLVTSLNIRFQYLLVSRQ